MNKSLLIIGLFVVVVLESGYIVMRRMLPVNKSMTSSSNTQGTPGARPSGSPRPMMAGKGMKLMDSPLAKYVYKIVPGPIGDDAKNAMVGFDVKVSTPAADGSVTVDLFPKDSDDQQQGYTVKKGNSLYFVEMTPADDNADSDKDMNYRDDYGVIVDSNGIIQ